MLLVCLWHKLHVSLHHLGAYYLTDFIGKNCVVYSFLRAVSLTGVCFSVYCVAFLDVYAVV